jgi:hypothetical protein
MFPRWIERGLGGCTVRAPLIDIGTPESFAQAESFMAGGARRLAAPENSLSYA